MQRAQARRPQSAADAAAAVCRSTPSRAPRRRTHPGCRRARGPGIVLGKGGGGKVAAGGPWLAAKRATTAGGGARACPMHRCAHNCFAVGRRGGSGAARRREAAKGCVRWVVTGGSQSCRAAALREALRGRRASRRRRRLWRRWRRCSRCSVCCGRLASSSPVLSSPSLSSLHPLPSLHLCRLRIAPQVRSQGRAAARPAGHGPACPDGQLFSAAYGMYGFAGVWFEGNACWGGG